MSERDVEVYPISEPPSVEEYPDGTFVLAYNGTAWFRVGVEMLRWYITRGSGAYSHWRPLPPPPAPTCGGLPMGEQRDGWRWRGWYAKRYGRRLLLAVPPFAGHRIHVFAGLLPQTPMIGVCWGRDDDEQWEITAGFVVAEVMVVFVEYREVARHG